MALTRRFVVIAALAAAGSGALVSRVPQATAAEITNFLGAYKASLVEGPLKAGGGLYRIRLAENPLPPNDVGKIRFAWRVVSFM